MLNFHAKSNLLLNLLALFAMLGGNVHVDFSDKLHYTSQLLKLLERIYAAKDAQAAAAIQALQRQHNNGSSKSKRAKEKSNWLLSSMKRNA